MDYQNRLDIEAQCGDNRAFRLLAGTTRNGKPGKQNGKSAEVCIGLIVRCLLLSVAVTGFPFALPHSCGSRQPFCQQ
ncbi:MAG TPA: hypothetical protein PL117_03375 [Accumulibacter sp.]|uniref:hypothetical protein n=1 Tax=Accumulibacter sp. TaxID=2053492 RepID=UPI002B795F3B|nr:hypothetical protein [Accumulibacter sp.]HRF71789.1 hypothetical protein [Accumulibacter sp.]